MNPADDPRLRAVAAAHPHPLLFAALSGAHLYGFASRDSDFDLRGAHVLPLELVVGLLRGPETIERMAPEAGLDLDLVTHDVAKFVRLMARPNGYVLEQLFSPLVVATSPAHAELREIGRRCACRRHAAHYLGFAATQWGLFQKQSPPRIKPLLYVYRVLLTGIHLLRTGEVEANLSVLAAAARLPRVAELIARKESGAEHGVLAGEDLGLHAAEYLRLRRELTAAAAASPLPHEATAGPALHDFLLRVRLGRG